MYIDVLYIKTICLRRGGSAGLLAAVRSGCCAEFRGTLAPTRPCVPTPEGPCDMGEMK